jgi:hypothetical protein
MDAANAAAQQQCNAAMKPLSERETMPTWIG